jgi:hypothetical protein
MTLGFIVLVIVFALLIGLFPAWPHSRSWGYYPGVGMGLVGLTLIALLLTDRL